MKKCIKCNIMKSPEGFYTQKKNKKQYTACKVCMNTRTIARVTRLKVKAVEYKGGKCECCGYNKNIKALEFHHKNPLEKDFGIAQVKKRNFENIKNELDKCVLICSNCHRELHDKMWRSKDTVNWKMYNSLMKKWNIVFPRPKKIHYCKANCKRKVSRPGLECIKCSHKHQERISWPSDEELSKLVWEKPRTTLSKELGVSDRAIAKRCKYRKIKQPGPGYWQKLRSKIEKLPNQ